MKVRRLEIENFRGVESGSIVFSDNTLLVGGNNVGKSTVCEALDLVLGPERMFRRPVVDEHDFALGRYRDEANEPVLITIRAVLVDLSAEALRRFGNHIRRWDDNNYRFVDEEPGRAEGADADGVVWALPITFRGRYDAEEDDFEGDTFFDHPVPDGEELDDEEKASLGEGRTRFTRSHKRLCGFVFLRTLRTGSRALGLQRGSLLDTVLKLGGEGVAEMWLETLTHLRDLDPAIGDVEHLAKMRTEIRERMGKFVNLAPGEKSTAFFASDLTREHLREVVRLFIATGPSDHPVPFARQGTGSINLLVFALLTLIADLKGKQSVIFAMEEPEIALPPHTQRRVTRFVRSEMGQTIVTSHSPYVIEQFEPENVVMLHRDGSGVLTGRPIDTGGIKPKAYRTERRQFAEAILGRAVLVVEGSTEASLLPIASSVLESTHDGYTHIDLSGVSIFTAKGDGDVPRYGPIFAALGKRTFGFVDQQTKPWSTQAQTDLGSYEQFWESTYLGIEELLVGQTTAAVLRRFLDEAVQRHDFPSDQATYNDQVTDADLPAIVLTVLKARKGEAYGYAALLVEQCETEDELPEFLRDVLLTIDAALATATEEDPLATTGNQPEAVEVEHAGEQEAS